MFKKDNTKLAIVKLRERMSNTKTSVERKRHAGTSKRQQKRLQINNEHTHASTQTHSSHSHTHTSKARGTVNKSASSRGSRETNPVEICIKP